MCEDIVKTADMHMCKCVKDFQNSINKIRIGRISIDMLDNVKIEYYGKITSLKQLANMSVENYSTISITVFEAKLIPMIERAILHANLDLNISSDGVMIRVSLPILTEERRKYLIKIIRTEAEKGKIALRNVRKLSNDKVKNCLKNKTINEDKEHVLQNKIQILTNNWIKKINYVLINKEKELLNF